MKKIRPQRPNKNKKKESEPFFSSKENKAKENSNNGAFFQAKLEIGDPSSPFEKEADAVADHVLQQNNDKKSGDTSGKQSVQRQAEKEEKPATKKIQRQAEEEEPAAKLIQKQAEEEEPAAKLIQKQAEEEEPAAKLIQKQAEEEEPAAKLIQKQAEEEEPVAKLIQKQAEEEEPATKRIQRQAEEEEPAAKLIQKQAEEEEPAAKLIQKQAEEEEPATKRIQRQAEEEEPVAKKEKKKDETQTMESVEAMIQNTKGQGMALPEEIKRELEAEMKADFSNVRIHTDAIAIQLSATLNAQAFTHGYDIYFNVGKYDPYSREGKHLLVHELTHVVQQKG